MRNAQCARRAPNAVANACAHRIGSAAEYRSCAAYRDCAIAYYCRRRIRPQTHCRAQIDAHICASAHSYARANVNACAQARAYTYTHTNTNAYAYTRHAHRYAAIYKPRGHHRRRGV